MVPSTSVTKELMVLVKGTNGANDLCWKLFGRCEDLKGTNVSLYLSFI